MRMPFSPAVILLLALAGYGPKPTAAAGTPQESTIPIAAAEADGPRSGDADGITAIDAATGDARAMPADSAAPSAYDLALRAEQAKDRESQRDMRAGSAPPAAPARLAAPTDLLGTDEAVTTGG